MRQFIWGRQVFVNYFPLLSPKESEEKGKRKSRIAQNSSKGTVALQCGTPVHSTVPHLSYPPYSLQLFSHLLLLLIGNRKVGCELIHLNLENSLIT